MAGLAQAHVVAEDGPALRGEEGHAFGLVEVEGEGVGGGMTRGVDNGVHVRFLLVGPRDKRAGARPV